MSYPSIKSHNEFLPILRKNTSNAIIIDNKLLHFVFPKKVFIKFLTYNDWILNTRRKSFQVLLKKYFSIPDQFLKFYPQFEGVVPNLESQDNKPKRKNRKLDNDKSSSTVKTKV